MKNYFIYIFSFFLLIITFYGAAVNDDWRASLKELVASVIEESRPSYDGSCIFKAGEKRKKAGEKKKVNIRHIKKRE